MTSLKVLSSAAAMALFLPMAAPTASFAQGPKVAGRGRGGGGGGGSLAGAARREVAVASAFSGGGLAAARGGARYSGGGGGVYRGGYGGGYRHGEGGVFIPGAVAGAVIGGAIAYTQSSAITVDRAAPRRAITTTSTTMTAAVAVAPAPVGDDAVAYCMQTYRSYDPASGTYLGYDGLRHPCP